MSKVDQIATKAMRYGGRALRPGAPFQASRRDARVLEAIGKSKPPETLDEDVEEGSAAPANKPDDIDALRVRYRAASGEDADKRWGAGKLREKIEAAAGGSYRRRDMRATD